MTEHTSASLRWLIETVKEDQTTSFQRHTFNYAGFERSPEHIILMLTFAKPKGILEEGLCGHQHNLISHWFLSKIVELAQLYCDRLQGDLTVQ